MDSFDESMFEPDYEELVGDCVNYISEVTSCSSPEEGGESSSVIVSLFPVETQFLVVMVAFWSHCFQWRHSS